MDIAFLGLGIMGTGMVRNLVSSGHRVTTWNRSDRALPPEIEASGGFTRASSIGEAVVDKPVVMICVTGPEAQNDIYHGPDGLLASLSAGTIVADATTTDPELTASLAVEVAECGGKYLDCPVFGSRNEAWNGELDVVCGGERSVYDQMVPLLDIVSKTHHYMGLTPKGAQMKLIGNLLVAAQIVSVGEALGLAKKVGVGADSLLGVLKVADYSSGVVVGTAGASLNGDFSPNFYLKHMLKDARLIGAFARAQGVPTPAAALGAELYQMAANMGLGDLNASGLHKMQLRQAGVEDE